VGQLTERVQEADVLVIEATFLERDAAIARDYGHLTAAEAPQMTETLQADHAHFLARTDFPVPQ
jgi:ribonuclease BN (tRNA processing enzyme)